MNGLFLTITKEEKENILDKHKSVYDGYATNSQQSNMTPLYTQDFANDKEGVQIDHLGNVSKYNNKMYMKESKNICNECGLYEEVCECGHGEVKGIGGSDEFDYVAEDYDDEDEPTRPSLSDLSKDMDYDDEPIRDREDNSTKVIPRRNENPRHFDSYKGLDEDECNECGDMYEIDSEYLKSDEVSDDFKEKLQESLDMFKRFKKYN